MEAVREACAFHLLSELNNKSRRPRRNANLLIKMHSRYFPPRFPSGDAANSVTVSSRRFLPSRVGALPGTRDCLRSSTCSCSFVVFILLLLVKQLEGLVKSQKHQKEKRKTRWRRNNKERMRRLRRARRDSSASTRPRSLTTPQRKSSNSRRRKKPGFGRSLCARR